MLGFGGIADVVDVASEMPGCVVIVVVARIKTMGYLQRELARCDEIMECRGGLNMPCAWSIVVGVEVLGIWRCSCCGCQTRELWAFVAVVRRAYNRVVVAISAHLGCVQRELVRYGDRLFCKANEKVLFVNICELCASGEKIVVDFVLIFECFLIFCGVLRRVQIVTGIMRVLKEEDVMKRGSFLSDEKTRKKGDLHQIVVHFGAFRGEMRVRIICHEVMRIGHMTKTRQRAILGDKRAFSFLIVFQKVVQMSLCEYTGICIIIFISVAASCLNGVSHRPAD